MSPHCSSFPMAGGSQGSSLGYSFPNWKMSLRSPSTIEIQDFFFFFFFLEKALNSSGPVSRLQHHPIQSLTKPFDLSDPTLYGPGQATTLSPAWTVTTASVSTPLLERKCKSLSRVQLFVTPWTVARQAPPSMEFSRPECQSG